MALQHIVLLAEDNPDDYELTKHAFKKNNIEADLRWVQDGQELLDYLHREGGFEDRNANPLPAVILLDLNMPRVDGREALKEIKKDSRLKSIPVVVMTTSEAEEDIAQTYDLGVSSYINKPVGFSEFTEVIRRFKEYWLEAVKFPSISD